MNAILSPLGSEVPTLAGPEPESFSADLGAGYFVGSLQVELFGARRVQLLTDFAFVEGPEGILGRRWEAQAGTVGDGSSIPWLLQRWVGSPLVGLHRFASVVHDVACIRKARRYQDVHRMYYLACLAAGEPLAWWLGHGVMWGGPRWRTA